jgi:pimeloyl-ACP methyl ester carboxylesterase
MSIEIRDIPANGFTFRSRISGSGREPIIFLHGGFETSRAWSAVMERLTHEDYRCLAPDQRGYSPGARPPAVEDYRLELIATDVIALADELGFSSFHLVGHDWGAAAGWTVVRDYPNRVASWTSLSIPHLASYGAAFDHPDQREKVAYIQDLIQPQKPEAALSHNGFEQLHQTLDPYGLDNARESVSVLSEPGALTAALNWYRATFGDLAQRGRAFAPFPVRTPTLTIWGNQDPHVGRPATATEGSFMQGPYRFLEWDAGHWLLHERLEDCVRELTRHLASHPVEE